jgi:hypothetical protein
VTTVVPEIAYHWQIISISFGAVPVEVFPAGVLEQRPGDVRVVHAGDVRRDGGGVCGGGSGAPGEGGWGSSRAWSSAFCIRRCCRRCWRVIITRGRCRRCCCRSGRWNAGRLAGSAAAVYAAGWMLFRSSCCTSIFRTISGGVEVHADVRGDGAGGRRGDGTGLALTKGSRGTGVKDDEFAGDCCRSVPHFRLSAGTSGVKRTAAGPDADVHFANSALFR